MVALKIQRDEHTKSGLFAKPKKAAMISSGSCLLEGFSHKSPELGPPTILATIDETPYTITEDSVRSQLQLADDGGIDDLPIADIYSGMDNLGYVTEGKLTFYKNKFSPQWRFLVHTILHCLSTKSGSWDQFGSSLAVALICLSDGRKFNWSSYIFKGMNKRIASQYRVFKLSSKLFANMKLNFEGQPMPLLAAMLSQAPAGEGAGVAAQAVPPPYPESIPAIGLTMTTLCNMCLHPQDNQLMTLLLQSLSMVKFDPKQCFLLTTHEMLMNLHFHLKFGKMNLGGHKKLFKDVVGKLVKKVKAMEAKLKPKKRKVVVSDSDQDEGGEQTVDLDALIALANAAVTVDSNIPPGGPSNDPAASSHIPSGVPTDGDFAPAHST
ncbi:hypothetical protein Tco_1322825, partial [Tanacetum coccineum]